MKVPPIKTDLLYIILNYPRDMWYYQQVGTTYNVDAF